MRRCPTPRPERHACHVSGVEGAPVGRARTRSRPRLSSPVQPASLVCRRAGWPARQRVGLRSTAGPGQGGRRGRGGATTHPKTADRPGTARRSRRRRPESRRVWCRMGATLRTARVTRHAVSSALLLFHPARPARRRAAPRPAPAQGTTPGSNCRTATDDAAAVSSCAQCSVQSLAIPTANPGSRVIAGETRVVRELARRNPGSNS
jgi:hypothetical protein